MEGEKYMLSLCIVKMDPFDICSSQDSTGHICWSGEVTVLLIFRTLVIHIGHHNHRLFMISLVLQGFRGFHPAEVHHQVESPHPETVSEDDCESRWSTLAQRRCCCEFPAMLNVR